MRSLISRLWMIGLALVLGAAGVAAAEGSPAPKKLKVLAVTGGHGYDEKEFDEMFLADPGIEYHHQQHPKALETIASSAVQGFDVVVLYDMYQPITEAQKKAFSSEFLGGKGLVVLHHAMADFQEWPDYERMIGGKFFTTKHLVKGVEEGPSGYEHDLEIPVEIADADHFITRGLKDFTIHDETYNRFDVDPADHVLLRTKHPKSGPIIGWTKPYGKGRVVVLQLGHDKQAYGNPSYRQLVSRSILWAARQTPEDLAMKPLFDGESLSGWKAEGSAKFLVEGGMLVGKQGPGGAAGDLFSEADLGDFECEVTWAMDWPGNSGVWFRYVNAGKAYQADILEYKSPLCWSGSLYCTGKMFIAMNTDASIVRRDGWNVFLIRAQKDHLVVLLNGRKVADVRDATSDRGKLGFQVHAGADFAQMALRVADIRARPLP